MKKIQKVIIIIAVLILPIFIFLFLKSFGTNEFVLPVYYSEGTPIQLCIPTASQHQLSKELIIRDNIDLPVLMYVPGNTTNKFQSDLLNVLDKYPKVEVKAIRLQNGIYQESMQNDLVLDSLDFFNYINCQLILGEDQLLVKPIINKYVLIDNKFMIRGYYQADNLDEIERLDVELDILLNY